MVLSMITYVRAFPAITYEMRFLCVQKRVSTRPA